MAIRQLSPDDLSVGSKLPWNVFDLHGRLLLRIGQVLESQRQIDGLCERGLFTDGKTTRIEEAEATPPPDRISAFSLILEARHRLELACAPNASRDNFADHIARVCALIGQALKLNKDAAMATMLLNREVRYSIRHSVDAAMITQIVASFVGMQESELASITAAALTMNISMLAKQDELQHHQQPLTDEERQIIHHHPLESRNLLLQFDVSDELWLNIVQDHHEAIDGSGYPAKKTGDDILLPTRIVSLSDIYCARVTGRDYRPPLRPNAALRAIFLGQGAVEKFLSVQFIKALGVFPPGTPVRLTNGEIAIVTHQGEKANAPLVASVIGPRGVPFASPIKRDTSLSLYSVREAVDFSELGGTANIQAIWKQ